MTSRCLALCVLAACSATAAPPVVPSIAQGSAVPAPDAAMAVAGDASVAGADFIAVPAGSGLSGCVVRGGAPFLWPESERATGGSYDEAVGFAGRWVARAPCTVLEVHPDGRFRWLNARDGAAHCTIEGTITGRGADLRWWRGPKDFDAHERAHKQQRDRVCDDMALELLKPWPPYAVRPAMLRADPDEIVLAYHSPFPILRHEAIDQIMRGNPGDRVRMVRFARIGSSANRQVDSGSYNFEKLMGSYMIDGRGGRFGSLIVTKDRRYVLQWDGVASEHGELFCLDLEKGYPTCDGYRFVPARGAARVMHFVAGGQPYLREVQSEKDLVPPPPFDRMRSWSLTPVEML